MLRRTPFTNPADSSCPNFLAISTASMISVVVPEIFDIDGNLYFDPANDPVDITVIRNGEAVIPNGDFVLAEGDRVFFTAPTNNLAKLLKNLNVISRRVRSVMLVGGGRVCYYLAQLLLKDGLSVRILEQNKERCRFLASELPEADVLLGNGTDNNVLVSEGISECDALVTLTGTDELNMIVSINGTGNGVPTVITKLNNVENRTIIEKLGLRSVVCPKELCCENIVFKTGFKIVYLVENLIDVCRRI